MKRKPQTLHSESAVFYYNIITAKKLRAHWQSKKTLSDNNRSAYADSRTQNKDQFSNRRKKYNGKRH